MPYGDIDGVIKITTYNLAENIKYIQESIDAFKREVEWEEMWDIEQATERLSQNCILFLLRDNEGALGHVWFKEDYLFNMFVSDRRETSTSIRFILHCFNYIPYKNINLYCDKWNIKAQKFFNKVGAKKISSYL